MKKIFIRSKVLNKLQSRRLLAGFLAAALALTSVSAGAVFASEDEGNIISVSTAEELDAALSNPPTGSTIRLDADIDVTSSATYSGATITIDGNGHTIDGQGIEKSAIRFTGTSDITLKNVTIQNCVGNIRYGGGGFSIFRGTLNVENSTFINNETLQGDGGGVLIDGGGGSFTNCTFYGNAAAAHGGAIAAAGATTIINCTILENTAGSNGGGIYNNARSEDDTTTVYNSIIIGNTAADGDDAYKLADGGNNLIGSVTNMSVTSDSSIFDITLEDSRQWLDSEPRSNGSSIPTIALLDVENSPAIDAANALYAPERDQRGVSRDGAPDIGSYELEKSVADIANAAKLEADQNAVTNPKNIDFTLFTKLAAEDKINAVEAVFEYDQEYYTANTKIVPTDFDVASVSVNEEKGVISVVIGVVKNNTISYDDLTALAQTTLTIRDGMAPGQADLTMTSFKIYSQGNAVDSTVVSDTGTTILSYDSGIPLDVNNDGVVDSGDLSLALYYFGAAKGDDNWDVYGRADINGDGKVDMVDIMLIVAAIHAAI